MPNPVGRPTIYSLEYAKKICEQIANDARSIDDVCAAHDWMPAKETVYEWQFHKPDFSSMLDRAKRQRWHVRFEKVDSDLADDSKDFVKDEKGRLYPNNPLIGRLRAKIGYYQWLAAKHCPEKYGDKQLEEKVTQTERDVELIKTVLQANRDKLDK